MKCATCDVFTLICLHGASASAELLRYIIENVHFAQNRRYLGLAWHRVRWILYNHYDEQFYQIIRCIISDGKVVSYYILSHLILRLQE